MATVAIKIKIMPDSPETDLSKLKHRLTEKITHLSGKVQSIEEEPIAFGLTALYVLISRDEDKDTGILETELEKLEGVSSAQIVDYRRAFG